ncbi:MAG: peptidase [Pyrinomonadaceae bacterium]|nr:peptidase [Pyrinomonadaceae bacterium]
MSILLIFIDGLGIGTRSRHNPLLQLGEAAMPLGIFEDEEPVLFGDGRLVRTDACLGVAGRPQSASGQTTILTGVNAPAMLGHHKQGFPNAALRDIINRHSIFLQLQQAGVTRVAFANAYSPRFFDKRPRWVSASTVAVEAAEMKFRTLDDLGAGQALYHDFTNGLLIEAGHRVEPRTPEQAAATLAVIARQHRFTLYEYFLTDRVGHLQDMAGALIILTNLARFVRALLARVDLDHLTVMLTSDHGNVEDLGIRNHTRNPVPTLVWGPAREQLARRVRSLADITPAIVESIKEEG